MRLEDFFLVCYGVLRYRKVKALKKIGFWLKAIVLVLLGIVFWWIALLFVLLVTRLGMLIVFPINYVYQRCVNASY